MHIVIRACVPLCINICIDVDCQVLYNGSNYASVRSSSATSGSVYNSWDYEVKDIYL